LFEVIFINVNNQKINEKFYQNKARAFNYIIKLALEYYLKNNLLKDDDYHLNIDERNVKTETKYFLEEYLNVELSMAKLSESKYYVKYFDSSVCHLIQIADVMSNIYFSNMLTHSYEHELETMRKNKYIIGEYMFPSN
jgi:hypothetical protein